MDIFNFNNNGQDFDMGNSQKGFDEALADVDKTTENFGDINMNLKITPVIEDIIVINAGRKNKCTIPEGYQRIDGDLNEGAGGDYIYLAVKYGTNAEKAVNGLAIVSGKKDNIGAPAGFEKINQDLNKGAGGKYIYLCIRRGKDKPISEVKVLSSKKPVSAAPEGFTLLGQDLNEGAGGRYIYLCYR